MPDDPTHQPLEGTDWRLTRGIAVDAARPVTARFVDGTLSGQGPVNRYRATYTLDGGRLRIGPATTTMMAGPEPAMAAEAAYLRLLDAVRGVARGGDASAGETLELRDEAGTPILTFDRAPSGLLALDGSWAVRGIRRGDAVVTPRAGSDASLSFDAAAGTVSGSAGVNRLNGPVELHNGRLRLGPFRTTRMAGEPEAMDEESDLLGALENAVAVDAEGDSLRLLDEDGGTLVQLRRPGS